MDFKSFMIQGVDGKFNFLLEEGFDDNQGSFSAKSVNNETHILDAEPISAALLPNVIDNIIDSSNTSSDDKLPPMHPSHLLSLWRVRSRRMQGKGNLLLKPFERVLTAGLRRAPVHASKVVGDASTPLDVNSNPDIHRKFKPVYGEIDRLRQDRAAVVSRVVPDAAMKLVHSDEIGVLVVRLVRAAIVHGRCTTFEEIARLKEPFVFEKMPGYRMSLKDEYDRAREDMAKASFPFLSEFTSNPYEYVKQLLSIKARSLRSLKAL
nr:hypothetical protein [Tanacetum cinerariifolium]